MASGTIILPLQIRQKTVEVTTSQYGQATIPDIKASDIIEVVSVSYQYIVIHQYSNQIRVFDNLLNGYATNTTLNIVVKYKMGGGN